MIGNDAVTKYDEWGVCRETIAVRFNRNEEIPTINYPEYRLRKSKIMVVLYESPEGPRRQGYKLVVSDSRGVRCIADSGTKFYTRRDAIEEGRKSASIKKLVADSRRQR